ncbi:iron complex transport system ATP-binding protein [Mobilisporobacter senegalensis]|uniref:Iron complex transport system ATP-binding protein n=1 Tax=Mobilisporobacter senegalensis TaxID=1329262 RepID=A0A3N1XGR2_9FIRM|nr:ABC transporter ATP-binding protein [Mobilisporobacter senegalensis]ROR25301.1 iron complex transport system ATP-binding protein [Mobilisporobacter senegalensis]
MRLQIENLSFSYGSIDAVEDICLKVKKGEFIGLIGPNGSGKSTVLKNLYRALKPDKGSVMLDNENLFAMSHKEAALKLGVVGQENEVPFEFKVEEIVAMGRSPHKKLFDIDTAEDKRIVHHALEHLGMENMAKRSYQNLSGGEKQRVIIARVIAQETDFLILDEPTNHLDISYQLQIFDFVKRLGVTVLSAIHDLNMAALYCDRIYVLKNGKIVLSGTPEEVLTPENIYSVYGVRCDVTIHPITGKVAITFLPAGMGI